MTEKLKYKVGDKFIMSDTFNFNAEIIDIKTGRLGTKYLILYPELNMQFWDYAWELEDKMISHITSDEKFIVQSTITRQTLYYDESRNHLEFSVEYATPLTRHQLSRLGLSRLFIKPEPDYPELVLYTVDEIKSWKGNNKSTREIIERVKRVAGDEFNNA